GLYSGYKFPKAVKKDRYRIAVISSLYLDSLELEKVMTHMPKLMQQGIDFIKGVEIAADTLNRMGMDLNIHIFDSRSDSLPVEELISKKILDTMDLVIGNVSGSDLSALASFASEHSINFISVTSPADASQTSNPYFTILHPRLVSHIEKIHRNINYRYPEDNVVFVYRNSAAEKNALNYFKSDVLNELPGRFSAFEMKGDELDLFQLLKTIDTNYHTTFVLGILDPAVTHKVLKQLTPYSKPYGFKAYCMPTAENIKSLGKTDEFPDLIVYYTTPYVIDKITPASLYISREYRRIMGGYVSDIVYKGFESVYFFASLLKKYGVPFNDHMGDNAWSFITPYKIVPVKDKGQIRYYENKYLYILRFENGILTYE
ncbi:MAG TPA: hypothetical protein PLP14_11280, partial [Chitinophagaceae bacterium]|nr:hypothetical protein [Chitinophagaceae bacterium]